MKNKIKAGELIIHATIFPGDYLPTRKDYLRQVQTQDQVEGWKIEWGVDDEDDVVIDRDQQWFAKFRVPALEGAIANYATAKGEMLAQWETTI